MGSPTPAALTLLTSDLIVEFTVWGEARTGGSKTGFVHPHTKKVIITERHPKPNREWRNAVADAAFHAYEGPLLDEPLRVEFIFQRVRPKGHYGSGRNAGVLKPSAAAYPSGRPDVLKLARAVEDALTGVLWRDDALIVDERLRKEYGERDCCVVRVYRV